MSYMDPDSARREIKFIAYQFHYHTLLQWLRDHCACFITPYPGRWINNIYFDSPDGNAYSDNIYGVRSRAKVRYRWYGSCATPCSGPKEKSQ